MSSGNKRFWLVLAFACLLVTNAALWLSRPVAAARKATLEYTVDRVRGEDMENIQKVLDSRGKQGWELVAVPAWYAQATPGNTSPYWGEHVLLVFKRPAAK
jgi:hypothetical protein